MRATLIRLVESQRFTMLVMVAVIANAIVLGVDTYGQLPQVVHDWCGRLDTIFIVFFVVEITVKLIAWRRGFFENSWNVFDLVVVLVSLVAGPFTLLRTFRVLRMLRIVSVVPPLRRVVEALVRAIPGIVAILGVLAVIFYIGAVLTTSLYGSAHPKLFGTLGASVITLFQLMLFDGWAGEVVRTVGETHWGSPVFFMAFTVLTGFAVLNLFIAVMVDALREEHDRLESRELHALEVGQKSAVREIDEVETAVRALEGKIDRVMEKLDAIGVAEVDASGRTGGGGSNGDGDE